MSADQHWQHVKELFQAALDLEPGKRSAFVREACRRDVALQAEVESLLTAHERAGSFGELPATDGLDKAMLRPGDTFGPYEITGTLGVGGMGEVYRARDPKLRRDVAIKVLPAIFSLDQERVARFEREAQLLASLNHPNIAQIYGVEEGPAEAGPHVRALVIELVEGETLADRIVRGPIPLDEALPIARQIAVAVAVAHEQGIVHRDLKPSNIKITSDGTVKVLDFGLAKLAQPAASIGTSDMTASPTITSPAMMTGVGQLLGTAAYMSPEQAKGRPADKRSDVWAFGCVLYEMLTGKRAFEGEDVSDTLASVLKGEPNWDVLPPGLGVSIRTLLAGCLVKDRRQRIADLSVALFVLNHLSTTERSAAEAAISATRANRQRTVLMAAAVVVVGMAAGYTAWMLKPAAARAVTRSTIPLPRSGQFSNPGVHMVALSADGNRLVYTANGRVYIRAMDQLEATPIRDAEGEGAAAAPRNLFWSPDGEWVGFWQNGQLKKVSRNGGAPVVLCAAENPFGATWTTDDAILYGQGEKGREGIWRVSSNGGKPEHLVKVESGQVAQGPQLLPGGNAILFTLVRTGDWSRAQIVVQWLGSGQRHVVLERGVDARYLPTGHLLYALEGTLLAVPFDVTTLAVSGGAVPLVEDILQANVSAQFAISSSGTLAYIPRDAVPGPGTRRRALVWVDRQGREESIKAPPRAYFNPRLSPDGTRVALDLRDQEADVWIWDLAREALTRLTFGPTFDQYGTWTPDGRSIIFSSSELPGPNAPRSIFRRWSDGTGTVEQLTRSAVSQFPQTVTPDGNALILREQTGPGTVTRMDLVLLSLGAEHRARPLLDTPFNELNAELSPDGHWIAYQSNESGGEEVYVRPFPNVDAGKWQISTGGGTQPLWARNGRELFYVSMNTLMRVPLTIASTFEAGTPGKLFGGPYLLTLPPGESLGRMYDVSPDGRRFLMTKDSGEADELSPRMILVQNWTEELKRLVPTH